MPTSASLISIPVICGFPAQIAVRISRPPPTPMIATLPLRSRYGSDVTSYCTQLSDDGLPSQWVMTVPASPSMAASAARTGVVGALLAGPHRNGALVAGTRTITLECAFQAE